ncbi:MAG: LysR family transcriptional regulator [bacterium]|nr:LysR family transcriptional regulator [bacterium]
MDTINYQHLLYFWMIAREGSVQGASQALHVTSASVSAQVKQLERSLGVQLLRKSGRGVELTETGEQVAEYAGEIFSKGRELLEMVRGQPLGRSRIFRVGVRDVMPKLVAFQMLQAAFESPEPLRVICHEGEMSQLVADLAVHKLDVVLSDTALDPLYKLRAYSHLLGESEVIIVGSPELTKSLRKPFPQSLQGAPFLLPTENSVLRRSLEQWFSDHGITPWIQAEFADSAMLKIAGRNGLGFFAIPARIEREVKSMYEVERVGAAVGVVERYYAISVERKIKHPAVLAIREKSQRLSKF